MIKLLELIKEIRLDEVPLLGIVILLGGPVKEAMKVLEKARKEENDGTSE